MWDMIEAFLMESTRRWRKFRGVNEIEGGEGQLNFWLLACTISLGTIWLVHSEMCTRLENMLRRQFLFRLKSHLMTKMGEDIRSLKKDLNRAVLNRNKHNSIQKNSKDSKKKKNRKTKITPFTSPHTKNT
ncbi:uncharacterized protein LOC111602725 [Drosophila hydei]|uniref:Uncharacterized protein LOC111602725 n=1 Tax=Drosophila hydei TaxID=7224 RepID=A0A6J1MAT0_DROHY|nr:uncharacterized protein LOC111602725 [Drosophila hydei]